MRGSKYATELTPKEEAFVAHFYIADGDRVKAAKVPAGYAVPTAKQEAYRLMKKPKIRKAIKDIADNLPLETLPIGVAFSIDELMRQVKEGQTDKDRREAARTLLKYGIAPPERAISLYVSTDTRSDEELQQSALANAAELGIELGAGTFLLPKSESARA